MRVIVLHVHVYNIFMTAKSTAKITVHEIIRYTMYTILPLIIIIVRKRMMTMITTLTSREIAREIIQPVPKDDRNISSTSIKQKRLITYNFVDFLVYYQIL